MEKLVIIGYGAAGFAAMIKANELGIKPILIGKGSLGGTCVNVGCIPSKKLLSISHFYRELRKKINSNQFPDFMTAFSEKDEVVGTLRKKKYEDILNSYDVKLVQGEAKFKDRKSVKVGNDIYDFERCIIATGSRPNIPEIEGLEKIDFWTSERALSPDKKVESLTIIGGRALALEFSDIYSGLGAEVSIIQRSPRLIPEYDPEFSVMARKIIESYGVKVFLNSKNIKVQKKNDKLFVSGNFGIIESERLLMATGRKPNIEIGLENAQIELNERGGIKTDEELRTTNPSVFAAGDVIGIKMLEPLAGRQGSIAVSNAFTEEKKKINYDAVPENIFISPGIAKVGKTSSELMGNMYVKSLKVPIESLARGYIENEEIGLVKLNVDLRNLKILGIQVISERSEEIINESAILMNAGATINDLIDSNQIFPSFSEVLRLAALSYYGDVNKMSCCV